MIISAPFRDRNPRLMALSIGIGAGLFILIIALFRVQVAQAEHYGNREQSQSLRRIRIAAARGEIVDRAGVVLANNRPSYDIAIYLDQLGHITKGQSVTGVAVSVVEEINRAMGLRTTVTKEDIVRQYKFRRSLPLALWRNVTPEQMATFEEKASHLPGADLIVNPVRQYPQGALAAHVLGYCGKPEQLSDEQETENFYSYQPDSVGKTGVEKSYDDDLRGAPGGRTIRVNPGGIKVGDDVGYREAERGNRVVLTLDMRIQRLTEEALSHAVLSPGREMRGAAVVLDPNDGEVLAMASLPDFDPNVFTPGTPAGSVQAVLDDPGSPSLNRATRATYPPGSTFKPITLLAGLESGGIALSDTAVCTGSLKVGNRSFGCWNRHGHGRVDAFIAMLQSCDVWFYQEGLHTGVDAITRTARELGLGQSSGLDFGRDLPGLVPTPAWKQAQMNERWWDGDTAQLSIGQSYLLVTPLQMANVAATLGNGGTRWRPYVVKRIETPDGQVLQQTPPQTLNRLSAHANNISAVRQAMFGATHSSQGTGRLADVPGLDVAGKTGTAEFDLHENGTTRRINRAWFIGFAPYEKPEIAVAVLIEDGPSGSHTAAPVAGQIFAGIFHKSTTHTGGGATFED